MSETEQPTPGSEKPSGGSDLSSTAITLYVLTGLVFGALYWIFGVVLSAWVYLSVSGVFLLLFLVGLASDKKT
jgi:hypothetical protein